MSTCGLLHRYGSILYIICAGTEISVENHINNEKKYRAIALDLDGTLTDSNKQLPQKNKEAIWKAIDSGLSLIHI